MKRLKLYQRYLGILLSNFLSGVFALYCMIVQKYPKFYTFFSKTKSKRNNRANKEGYLPPSALENVVQPLLKGKMS